MVVGGDGGGGDGGGGNIPGSCVASATFIVPVNNIG